LIWPAGLVVDAQGHVYVTDEWLNRVSVFDREGNFLSCWNTVQNGDSEPNGASGIAIDANSTLFVTDGRSHKVRKFATNGTFLGSWGRLGSGAGELDSPWGLTVDDEGYVYVADHKNHRVQKFTSDGDFVAQIGSPGTKRASLSFPTDVAVDPDGDVYICTWNKNAWDRGRIQIFDAVGRFLTGLVGDAQQLSAWAEMTVAANTDYLKRRREVRSTEPEWTFAQPTAVAFDAANSRLLVADTQRSRIQIYNKFSDYLVPQMNL
jgi:DNA-binding beta-propeller fold protein YncE